MIEDPNFSQRAFAVGALTGIRSFRIAPTGVLTGVWHTHPFEPGENLARCCVRHSGAFSLTACHRANPEPVNHRPGSLSCTCGFYAYFDTGHNAHHKPGNVLALIQGWRVMSVGARGFRCEKARLVAFVEETPEMQPRVAAARWLIGRAARALRIGQPAWPVQSIPEMVRRSYPGVPVYPGVAAALADHPLTPPERPREAAA